MRRGEVPGHVNLALIKEVLGILVIHSFLPILQVRYNDQLASVWHPTYNSAAR